MSIEATPRFATHEHRVILGRIPGFTDRIFSPDSIPFLSLTANIGLCLFLFLVGMEIDAGIIKRNWRLSASIALAGMVVRWESLSSPTERWGLEAAVTLMRHVLFL